MKIQSYRGLYPIGYYYNKGQCYDVNECLQQNDCCSHGCVNISGDFYCACSRGMTRDPADPKKSQYLHANARLKFGIMATIAQLLSIAVFLE